MNDVFSPVQVHKLVWINQGVFFVALRQAFVQGELLPDPADIGDGFISDHSGKTHGPYPY